MTPLDSVLVFGRAQNRPGPLPPIPISQLGAPIQLRPVNLCDLSERLSAGRRLQLRHPGDRVRFAECLLESLPGALAARLSLSTSLHPSSARPFLLALTG